MARLNKAQRDTLLHQALLIEQVAAQLEAMPCKQGWQGSPQGPYAAMTGVLRQAVKTLEWLEVSDI